MADERVAFEAWVKQAHPTRWPNPGIDGKYVDADGEYRNAVLRMMWSAWQAASALLQKRSDFAADALTVVERRRDQLKAERDALERQCQNYRDQIA